MSKTKIKEYANEEITVVWNADVCIHAGECVKGSKEVFKPKDRPWIQIENSDSKQIMETIDKCPSGALSYRRNTETELVVESNQIISIKATENGPFLVKGSVELESSSGEVIVTEGKTTALCRCGASSNKPFCDGSHTSANFKG